MNKKDKAVTALGRVVAQRREGNDKVAQVALIGEERRSPRTVRVHAMANDCSAIKAALAQRDREKETLAFQIGSGLNTGR